MSKRDKDWQKVQHIVAKVNRQYASMRYCGMAPIIEPPVGMEPWRFVILLPDPLIITPLKTFRLDLPWSKFR